MPVSPLTSLPISVLTKVMNTIYQILMYAGYVSLTSHALPCLSFPTEALKVRPIEPVESDLAKQVEYDMDDVDRAWLDQINTERRKEGLDIVSYELFEVIMDRLEKEWFDLVSMAESLIPYFRITRPLNSRIRLLKFRIPNPPYLLKILNAPFVMKGIVKIPML